MHVNPQLRPGEYPLGQIELFPEEEDTLVGSIPHGGGHAVLDTNAEDVRRLCTSIDLHLLKRGVPDNLGKHDEVRAERTTAGENTCRLLTTRRVDESTGLVTVTAACPPSCVMLKTMEVDPTDAVIIKTTTDLVVAYMGATVGPARTTR